MLIKAVYKALKDNDIVPLLIIADYIEEFHSKHPEKDTYVKRLRNQEKLPRIQTLLDIVLKFGSRWERKRISRTIRIALRMRRLNRSTEYKFVGDTTSLKNRQAINIRINKRMYQSQHSNLPKKWVISLSKRVTFESIFWYKILIINLLQPMVEK